LYIRSELKSRNLRLRYASGREQLKKKLISFSKTGFFQDFAGQKGHILCGVFDGHGPRGREVARHVRDTLPVELAAALKPRTGDEDPSASSDASKPKPDEDGSGENGEDGSGKNGDASSNADLDSFDKSGGSGSSSDVTSDESQQQQLLLSTWKNVFVRAFEQVDEELRRLSGIDCICSGTTAVAAVRQVGTG
jgi:hypothetical protein